MFGTQLIGLVLIVSWVALNMVPFFALLKTFGLFRVDAFVEEMGMDAWEHGGGAYNIGSQGLDATETGTVVRSP